MNSKSYPDQAGKIRAEETLITIQTLIGATVMVWADLENQMIRILSLIVPCPLFSAGLIFYSHSNLSGQLSLVLHVCEHNLNDSAIKTKLRDCLNKFMKLSKIRNRYVHSSYHVTYDVKAKRPSWKIEWTKHQLNKEMILLRDKVQISQMEEHVREVALNYTNLKFIEEELAIYGVPIKVRG